MPMPSPASEALIGGCYSARILSPRIHPGVRLTGKRRLSDRQAWYGVAAAQDPPVTEHIGLVRLHHLAPGGAEIHLDPYRCEIRPPPINRLATYPGTSALDFQK